MKVGYDDFYDVILRAKALASYIDGNDKALIKATLDNNGRAANITETVTEVAIDTNLFTSDEERTLYNALSTCEEVIPGLVENKDYLGVIKQFETLNDAVENFFEKILVMDEDTAVRQNRLSLVKHYNNLLGSYYKLDEVTFA